MSKADRLRSPVVSAVAAQLSVQFADVLQHMTGASPRDSCYYIGSVEDSPLLPAPASVESSPAVPQFSLPHNVIG